MADAADRERTRLAAAKAEFVAKRLAQQKEEFEKRAQEQTAKFEKKNRELEAEIVRTEERRKAVGMVRFRSR